MSEPTADASANPERLYVVRPEDTAPRPGRRAPRASSELDLVTLVVTRGEPPAGLGPECAAILRMCEYPLSVAEISAYLVLPVSTVTPLLAELLADARVEARAPIPTGSLPDADILEAVMHGLREL